MLFLLVCTARTRIRCWAACASLAVAILFLGLSPNPDQGASGWVREAAAARSCPPEMGRLGGLCIDRWEAHMVDKESGLLLSPFYPPEPRLLAHVLTFWSAEASRVGSERARTLALPPLPSHQRGTLEPKAVSAPGMLPHGYLTYYSAKRACENAGKRLCTEPEWVRACRGNKRSKHPYGEAFRPLVCNVERNMHPAYELHGNSSLGHLDPRLHLVVEEGERPLLLETGTAPGCVSTLDEGVLYDMEGNLDEWIDDPNGTFVGGFFSRQTREGCDAKIEGHSAIYADYSLGVRCCLDAR